VGDTLRAQYFRLDRQDRLEGIITTHPETSAQFFELWRPQPETVATWAGANLQTIQRAAKITIKPAGEAGAYELAVQVDDARYSLPERQIDNSAGALRLYSADAPRRPARWNGRRRPREPSPWAVTRLPKSAC
jgi:hypothetical protein